MKTFAKHVLFLAVAGLIVAPALQAQGKSGKDKVDLFHKGHIISVASAAVPAHLAHGDQVVSAGSYTVTVIIEDQYGNVLASQSADVSEDGSATFTLQPLMPPLTYVLDSQDGYATFTLVGGTVTVTEVTSNASATYVITGPGGMF